MPSERNAGRSPERVAASVPGLMHPSSETVPESVSMGTISPDNAPLSAALDALDWLFTANSSWLSLVISYF